MRSLGGLFGVAALVLAGAMLADLLSHPAGSTAAFNGLSSLWTPSLAAAAGQPVR